MQLMRHVRPTTLEVDTVLLVETEENKEYIFIVKFDEDFTQSTYLETRLTGEEEDKEIGNFLIPFIKVGTPITGVRLPVLTTGDSIIKIDGMLHAPIVKSIEVYK